MIHRPRLFIKSFECRLTNAGTAITTPAATVGAAAITTPTPLPAAATPVIATGTMWAAKSQANLSTDTQSIKQR